jgi:hypothetical protein
VELTALEPHAGQPRLARSLQPGVIVTGDEAHPVQTPLLQGGEKFAPMHFGFGERDAGAENRTAPVSPDADRDEQGATSDHAAMPHFFIAGVENEVWRLTEGPLTPRRELLGKTRLTEKISHRIHFLVVDQLFITFTAHSPLRFNSLHNRYWQMLLVWLTPRCLLTAESMTLNRKVVVSRVKPLLLLLGQLKPSTDSYSEGGFVDEKLCEMPCLELTKIKGKN